MQIQEFVERKTTTREKLDFIVLLYRNAAVSVEFYFVLPIFSLSEDPQQI